MVFRIRLSFLRRRAPISPGGRAPSAAGAVRRLLMEAAVRSLGIAALAVAVTALAGGGRARASSEEGVRRLVAEVAGLEAARATLVERRAQLEGQSRAEAATIEELKLSLIHI